MYAQGKAEQHGKPFGAVGRDDQPDAREGQAGRERVAERPVVLRRPGNAGGGKGPWFKADAGSDDAQEIGYALGNSVELQTSRNASHAEAKGGPGRWSGKCVLPDGGPRGG